jgi:hypothetical protein
VYEKNDLDNTFDFFVRTIPPPADNASFDLRLTILDADNVRITAIEHWGIPAYAAKGIPDALIPEAARVLNRNVQSSPLGHDDTSIYRTEAAEKYWVRLLAKGATYNAETTIYTYPRPALAAPPAPLPPPPAGNRIPERMERRFNWYGTTALNWCITYYVFLVLSIATPAIAAVLAFWKDSYPWIVGVFAAIGTISSGVLGQLKPKTEWDNFRNAYVYANAYENGLIDIGRLNQAMAEAERYLGPVPQVPPAPPPAPNVGT